MRSPDTLFRCVLERAADDQRKRKVVKVWAFWPGKARELAERKLPRWTVIGVEPDFSSAAPRAPLPNEAPPNRRHDVARLPPPLLEWILATRLR